MTLRKFATCCAWAFLGAISSSLHATWTLQTVDTTSASGFGTSLALASNGTPSISYVRPTTGFSGFFDVYYATSSGGAWTKESVFTSTNNPGDTTSISLTELGTPVVSFTKSGTFLRCYIRSSGSWGPLDAGTDDITTAGGDFVSGIWRGTEAAPDPVIAFSDDGGGDLERAFFNNGHFATSTLDASSAGFSCSLAAYGSHAAIISLKNGKLLFLDSNDGGSTFGPYIDPMFDPLLSISATYCAVAVAPATKSDATNIRAHIIYFQGNVYYYLTNDTETGTWTSAETIATSALPTIGYFGLSIAVGTDGVPRVAFLDYNDKTLKYSERSASGWSTPQTIDANGGITCSLKLDTQNRPRIAYGTLAFDSMSSSWSANGVKYAAFSSPSPVTLSFAVTGKAKRSTGAARLAVKGTASSNAASIQWGIGKKSLKKAKVNNGRWNIKVSPLAQGKNKVRFRAVGSNGKVTAFKTITITRK